MCLLSWDLKNAQYVLKPLVVHYINDFMSSFTWEYVVAHHFELWVRPQSFGDQVDLRGSSWRDCFSGPGEENPPETTPTWGVKENLHLNQQFSSLIIRFYRYRYLKFEHLKTSVHCVELSVVLRWRFVYRLYLFVRICQTCLQISVKFGGKFGHWLNNEKLLVWIQ